MEWNVAALKAAGLDALLVGRPGDVRLVSGYWPMVGTSIAIVTAEGRVGVLAPEDEAELVAAGWADVTVTFAPGSLKKLYPVAEAMGGPLCKLGERLKLHGGRVAICASDASEPMSYIAMHRFGVRMREIADEALPMAALVAGEGIVARMKQRLTRMERGSVAQACEVAGRAFGAAGEVLRVGVSEVEAGAALAARLVTPVAGRSGGFVAVMSGERSARAFGAFAQSSSKKLAAGELVLVHCNSQVDGFWTDITRTFCLGEPSELQGRMYAAVDEARSAALAAVKPGVRGCDVDAAARDVMERHGFGEAFRHSTGHGVGYAAIDHNALPRIHPASEDVLEAGMTFNIEPGAYLPKDAVPQGMRHCDVVWVTDGGCEVVSGFQGHPGEMQLR